MNSTRCAACKHLRRRCPSDCIFSPYFPPNNPRRFDYVHKIYGASNVGKMLQDLPVNLRAEAANTLYYEAYCRIKDPVYGCVGMISILHQEIHNAECELAKIQAEIAAMATNQSQSGTLYDDNYKQVEIAHTGFLAPQGNGFLNSTSYFDLPSSFN